MIKTIDSRIITLKEIWDNIINKTYSLPEWQRDRAWSDDVIKQWKETILDESCPFLTSSINIYQLSGQENKNIYYIWDGAQRTYHSLPFIKDEFERDKRDISIFYKALENKKVHIILSISDTEQEMVNQFRIVNTNTTKLTCYDLIRPIICDELYGKSSGAKGLIEDIEAIMDHSVAEFDPNLTRYSIDKKINQTKGDNMSFRHRKNVNHCDAIATFLRFAMPKQYNNSNYTHISTKFFDEKNKQSLLLVHKHFYEYYENISGGQAEKHLKDFETCLQNCNKFLKDIEIEKPKDKLKIRLVQTKISNSLIRSFYAGWVYMYANSDILNINKIDVKDFFERLIKDHNGKSTAHINGVSYILGIQKVGVFRDLFFKKYEYKEHKRKNRDSLARGLHYAHIEPFSKNGEGEVVIQSAIENLTNGNKSLIKHPYAVTV